MPPAAEHHSPAWLVREFRDGDEVAINDGFNQIFSTARALDDWAWKFPAEDLGRWIMIARDSDDQLLVHFATIPMRVQIDGRTWLSGHAVDVYGIPRPGIRRQDVFLATVREFYARFGGRDRLAFLFGFPGDHHLDVGRENLGYVDGAALGCLRRPVTGRDGSGRIRTWVQNLAQRWTARGNWEVREGLDAAAADDLWRRAAPRYPVAAVRDSRWLTQRYSGRPGVRYRHLAAFRGRRAHAWAVLAPRDGATAWAELLWDGDPSALVVLERTVREIARTEGSPHVEFWLRGDPLARAVLVRQGFVEIPHPLRLKLSSVALCSEIDAAAVADRFYVTMGDTDLI